MEMPLEARLAELQGLLRTRDLAAAAARADALVAMDPRDARAWFVCGVVAAESGAIAVAGSRLARSFEIEGAQSAPNHLLYANVLFDAREPAAAEAQARKALALVPAWPPALASLAQALGAQDRRDEALAACDAAMAADPGYARARLIAAAIRWSRARALSDSARVIDAIDEYRASLALDDADANKWNDLGNALTSAGMLAEAQGAYREALHRNPGYHQVESNLIIGLHYDPAIDPQAMFKAHRAWAARHARPLYPAKPLPLRALGANDRIRIGFMSPALRAGPTGAFLMPLLENLDRKRFDVHLYRIGGTVDATSERLRKSANAWRDLQDEDDAAIAGRIRADELDLLVDLAGHTPGGRLLVLARKPAPLVATWLDYFDTTGLDSVDYLIGDPVSTPPEGAQRFSEKVLLLDPCRLCYEPPEYAPDVAPAPALRNGYVTFGSFNRLSKLAPPVIASWAEVLASVPASRLVLKNAALVDPRARSRIEELFAQHGIGAARLELRGHSPHPRMLAEYADIDIALDPFPYNGGLTTCEALWMGVPVLAQMGASMISRQSASLLASAGLTDWISDGERELAALAQSRAGDVAALGETRAGLRGKLLDSALTDAAGFAARFGEIVRQCVSRHGGQ